MKVESSSKSNALSNNQIRQAVEMVVELRDENPGMGFDEVLSSIKKKYGVD